MTDDLPPDVRRDLYDDAVRLNRQQFWLAIASLVFVAVPAVWVSYVASQSRLFERALIAASAVLAWVGRTVWDRRRLRRTDPYQYDE